MSSESVCQVARKWVDMGSFHPRLVVRFVIFTVSVRNILDTRSYMEERVAAVSYPKGVGLWPLACWDCGFESRWMSITCENVCCHVEVSAAGRSLVQRCPTECGVSECDL
jgi:hypothetical protein